ncbi:MAG: TPM domain-containing protein, partial [Terriglobales bacterium]
MKRLAKVSAIFCVVLVSAVCFAEPIASLRATNYVNDFAGVLDAATQARLNDLCQQVDQKAHAQIAVVTVKSLDGQDVESYAVALYQKFGIGAKGKDHGVLILLATQDRKYQIQVGYGLEGILPDGKVGGFGREAVPFLRSGDYAGAVTLMTARVASVIAQDAGVTLGNQPRQVPTRQQPGGGAGAVILVIFLLFFVVIPILRAIFRGGSGGPRGGGG